MTNKSKYSVRILLVIFIQFNELFPSVWTETYKGFSSELNEIEEDLSDSTTETESEIISNGRKDANEPESDKYVNPLTIHSTENCITSDGVEGFCLNKADCVNRDGNTGYACGTDNHYCCTFRKTCGDISKEFITYFQSPEYPDQSVGTLACDYDVILNDNTCAVRIEYEKVNLARKLGGLCDIDQIFILNSLDGPTTGQCGSLTGYATTVAVDPTDSKPLKLAVLIQNEDYYHWFIKITQIPCSKIKRFKVPRHCGIRKTDMTTESSNNYVQVLTDPLSTIIRWWNKVKTKDFDKIWWNYPEPVLNTFYYESTKRQIEGNNGENNNDNSKNNLQRRIITGTETEINEFPWMVAILLKKLFFCGGALISNLFVVTAAHCFMTRETPIESLLVQLGDHDLTSDNETNHLMRKVLQIYFHSHFHAFLLANDIALLKLNAPVIFTDSVQPICLPVTGDAYTGEKATVIGWGVTSVSKNTPSPTLQKLNVEVLSNKQCAMEIDDRVHSGMLCASPSGVGGTCFGDSGGPLIIEMHGVSKLIGVVSFGVTGCAITPGFPDLYTRITEYLNWINVNTV